MNNTYLREIIKEAVHNQLQEADSDKNEKSKGAKQVEAFLNSLSKSALARKLKTIDTNKEKLEILIKFAEMIDFPKDKISKLSLELRSK